MMVQSMEAVRSIRESIGGFFPEQSIVEQHNYEEALNALSQMEDQVISTFTTSASEREAWGKA